MTAENNYAERYLWYVDTMERAGTYLLTADDETIGYQIFEEFDIGACTFLHISQLTILFESGFISKSEMDKSALLRKMAFDLQANNEWDMSLFRTSENWKKLLQLADEINSIRTSNAARP